MRLTRGLGSPLLAFPLTPGPAPRGGERGDGLGFVVGSVFQRTSAGASMSLSQTRSLGSWRLLLLALVHLSLVAGCQRSAPVEVAKDQADVSVRGVVLRTVRGRDGGEELVPVDDAVVFLVGVDDDGNRKLAPVVVELRDGKYVPEHACVVVGQTLVLKSADGRDHHTSFATNHPFGEIVPVNPRSQERVFQEAEDLVVMTCDLHPEERGYLTVAPSTRFTRTAKDGSFTLVVPATERELEMRAVHPVYGARSTKAAIGGAGQAGEIRLVLLGEARR